MEGYDRWLESPYDVLDTCENCDDEGCHLCNRELADDYRADLKMQAIKDGEPC